MLQGSSDNKDYKLQVPCTDNVVRTSLLTMAEEEEVILLVLGDGDYSYSCDWATYLATKATVFQDKSLHLIATGLDSRKALDLKYKDSNFMLNKLIGVDGTPRTSGVGQPTIRVSIHHNTNAIHSNDRPHTLPAARHVS